jgi:hypothetical protein
MSARYRPTVWPSAPLQVPSIEVPDHVERLDEFCLLLHGPFREVELPVDFYLREPEETDLNDPSSLAAFATRWGRASDLGNRDVGGDPALDVTLARAHARGWLPGRYSVGSNGAVHELLQHAERLGLDDPSTSSEWRPRLVHVVEVGERVYRLRRLAVHLRAWQRDEDIEPLWQDYPEPGWFVFVEILTTALSAFQPRVEVPGVRRSLVVPGPTAYSVAALQLLNDLSNDTPYRTCANERCPLPGHLFTRQRGRSQYGQHRTIGTRYCSRECAKAQAARERRRRNRQDEA